MEDREQAVEALKEQIQAGDIQPIREWLQVAVEEAEGESAEKAAELITRLDALVKEQKLLSGSEKQFGIYQITARAPEHDYRFMNLDFVKSEAGEAVVEQAPVREGERVIDAEFTEKTEAKEELPAKTEKVVLPEGTIEFELDEEEHLFDVGEVSPSEGNFTQAEKAGNLSGPSSHSSGSFSGQETSWKGEKPSVRQELKKIETEQKQRQKQQQSRRKPRNQQRREQKKVKGR